MRYTVEKRGEEVAVGWAQGRSHRNYEDRYRMLTNQVPLVRASGRGELIAVMDGVGSAPQGLQAAQFVADALLGFYQGAKDATHIDAATECKLHSELCRLLKEASFSIHAWGTMEGSQRPLGAAAATVAWITADQSLHVFHAGDTQAVMLREDGTRRLLSVVEQTADGALCNYFGSPGMTLGHRPVR